MTLSLSLCLTYVELHSYDSDFVSYVLDVRTCYCVKSKLCFGMLSHHHMERVLVVQENVLVCILIMLNKVLFPFLGWFSNSGWSYLFCLEPIVYCLNNVSSRTANVTQGAFYCEYYIG
jgi:hypothetical protein